MSPRLNQFLKKSVELLKLTLRDAQKSYYFQIFSRRGVLIFISIQFATTFLYSKGNLQSNSNIVIKNKHSNFKQNQQIEQNQSSIARGV